MLGEKNLASLHSFIQYHLKFFTMSQFDDAPQRQQQGQDRFHIMEVHITHLEQEMHYVRLINQTTPPPPPLTQPNM